MRILLLASRFPYPLSDGEDLRIFHFARHLAPQHRIDLLCYGPDTVPPGAEGVFASVRSLGARPAGMRSARPLQRVRDAFSVQQIYPFDSAVLRHIEEVAAAGGYDASWVPAWEMIPYAARLAGLPACIDAMDDGVLEHARDLRHARGFGFRLIGLKRLWMTYRFERAYFSRAAACILVSERDAAMLRRVVPGAAVTVIHNGVDAEYFRPLEIPEFSPSIVFEGNMSFGPSVDAIGFFCGEILPRILEREPRTTLTIVGKDPAPSVRELAGPGVEVTGFVEDVRPHVARANVFVCPMRKGAGIKNKVLQAWAMGKAVVATTVACGGLRAAPEENIVVRDAPAAFAEAVVGLLRDPARRERIGSAGRQTVLQHYSWPRKAAELEEVLRGARRPGTAA